jgi:hypothetical protein
VCDNVDASKQTKDTKKSTNIIEGHSATFPQHKDSVFLDACCGKGPSKGNVYCITTKGLLCCFSSGSRYVLSEIGVQPLPPRLMEKWVNLKATGVFSVSVTDRYIACGCSDGIIRYRLTVV